MKNIKVAYKLAFGFIIVAVLTALVGVGGTYGISDITRMGRQMYDEHLVASEAMGDMRETFQQERSYLRDMLIYIDDPGMINECLENINAAHLRGEAAIQKYMSAVTDMSREGPLVEVGELTNGPYLEAKEKIIASALAGNAQGVLEGIEEAAEYVSTIENNLAISERNHVAWAADQAAASDALSKTLTVANVSIVIVACLVAIFLGVYLSRQISKPLILMSNYFRHAGTTGDITISPENLEHMKKISSGKDEIGNISSSLAAFMERITAVSEALETVSDGDLTVELSLLSETDVMGKSMQKMLSNLNGMFGEVNAATDQVYGGAKQIADGAQALSQGSTEQASAVEELSATIASVLTQTQDNSQNAQKTLNLVNQVGSEMQDTIKYMEELKNTMSGISHSSEKISKVIKVIDDIAFQTNILALNAAVEAARAGQHGKGFAVVAEEVRNLASKSAEAAKETAELVQTSVEHVQRGNGMVDRTSQSVSQVSDTAMQAQERIVEINGASQQQKESLAQINEGIEQISQVVQTNNATAEENAASSEELSGQSQILRQLVGRFRTKDSGYPALSHDFNPHNKLPVRTQDTVFSPSEPHEEYGKY